MIKTVRAKPCQLLSCRVLPEVRRKTYHDGDVVLALVWSRTSGCMSGIEAQSGSGRRLQAPLNRTNWPQTRCSIALSSCARATNASRGNQWALTLAVMQP